MLEQISSPHPGTPKNPSCADPQSSLAAIKAGLLASLPPEPLTPGQQRQHDELLPLGRSVATNLLKRWKRHAWLHKEDLYQEAAAHLADAIRKYDATHSPSLRGWIAKYVRWRLQDWLRKEHAAHDHKPLVSQNRRDCHRDSGEMQPGKWDRYGHYRERPSRRLEIAEVATAVRHAFDPRDVEILCDREMGAASKDIAYKHRLTPDRIRQVVAEVREYIRGKIDGSDVRRSEVVAALMDFNREGREQAMRMLGYEEQEILKIISV